MSLTIVLVLLALIAAVSFRGLRSRAAAARDKAELEKARSTGRFHAVSIRTGDDSCAAAHALRGQRFLSGCAPALPLPECDAATCRCRYMHHGDRRAGADRRSPFQGGFGGSAARVERDRRDQADRRSEDLSA